MNRSRTLTTVCCLLATAFLAFAQTPTPRAAPAPEPAPIPAPLPAPAPAPMAPMPPMPPAELTEPMELVEPMDLMQLVEPMEPMELVEPMPPMEIDVGDLDLHLGDLDLQMGDLDLQMSMANEMVSNLSSPEMQEQLEAVKEQAGRIKLDLKKFAKEDMQAAKEMAWAFAPQSVAPVAPVAPMPPMPPMPPKAYGHRGLSDDHLYSEGQRALDGRHWDEALDCFSQVISRNGSRLDGALYWKAYALGKLGRRDEAAASIAELRKSYAGSRWLDDAKALELELKQAAGQNVAPEAESDEELKLMAINGLMQSDPERAIPLLESQLKGSASPKVKRNTLFVLAQCNSPKAQALLEQIARGGGNPDLQLKAISYMDQRRKPNNNAQVLAEIYAATNDVAVKRAILMTHASIRDKDFLLNAARTEKSPELREFAIAALAGNNGTPELWQLYQAETTSEGKLQLLRYMYSNSNPEKLLEVVRNEKDPKVRASAVRVLASQRTGVTGDSMVSLYNAEQDAQIKQSIMDGLYSQHNAKALVDIARAEKDTKLKIRIVERLSNMKSKEASDYLAELLKK
jgi:hypothetical protein